MFTIAAFIVAYHVDTVVTVVTGNATVGRLDIAIRSWNPNGRVCIFLDMTTRYLCWIVRNGACTDEMGTDLLSRQATTNSCDHEHF